VKRWRCWVHGYPGNGEQVFSAVSAGKAKAQAFAIMRELGWSVKFTDVRCAREQDQEGAEHE